MDTSLFRKWWLITLKGIFITALGMLLLVHPYTTIKTFVLLFGVTLITVGAITTYFGFANQTSNPSWQIFITEGLLELALGFSLLVNPIFSLYVIIILSGFWILFLGGFQIMWGWNFRKKINGWKYPIIYGLLTSLVGLAFIFYPMNGVLAFAIVFGMTLLLFGFFLILTSQQMNKQKKNF